MGKCHFSLTRILRCLFSKRLRMWPFYCTACGSTRQPTAKLRFCAVTQSSLCCQTTSSLIFKSAHKYFLEIHNCLLFTTLHPCGLLLWSYAFSSQKMQCKKVRAHYMLILMMYGDEKGKEEVLLENKNEKQREDVQGNFIPFPLYK